VLLSTESLLTATFSVALFVLDRGDLGRPVRDLLVFVRDLLGDDLLVVLFLTLGLATVLLSSVLLSMVLSIVVSSAVLLLAVDFLLLLRVVGFFAVDLVARLRVGAFFSTGGLASSETESSFDAAKLFCRPLFGFDLLFTI